MTVKALTEEQFSNATYEAAKVRGEAEMKKMKAEIPVLLSESEAIGVLKKIRFDKAQNDVLKYAVLHKIKENKAYKKVGKTWEEFCDEIGEARKTVDTILKDAGPLLDRLSAESANLLGMPLSKIRYLGKSISGRSANLSGNALVFEGREIPLTPENKDDIEEVIDTIKETHKQEKKDLQKKLEREAKKKEKILKADIENLTLEKRGLLEDNKRLSVFEKKQKTDEDIEWCERQMAEIEKACDTFAILCEKFIIDERLEDDIARQAKVEAYIERARLSLRNLYRDWVDQFIPDPDLYN